MTHDNLEQPFTQAVSTYEPGNEANNDCWSRLARQNEPRHGRVNQGRLLVHPRTALPGSGGEVEPMNHDLNTKEGRVDEICRRHSCHDGAPRLPAHDQPATKGPRQPTPQYR